jgi:hypothetical protein
MIPVFERAKKVHALDRVATVIAYKIIGMIKKYNGLCIITLACTLHFVCTTTFSSSTAKMRSHREQLLNSDAVHWSNEDLQGLAEDS